MFQESLLYTSIPLRQNVSARISLRGLRRLILVDILHRVPFAGFLVERLIFSIYMYRFFSRSQVCTRSDPAASHVSSFASLSKSSSSRFFVYPQTRCLNKKTKYSHNNIFFHKTVTLLRILFEFLRFFKLMNEMFANTYLL